jgi:hypothetical protein
MSDSVWKILFAAAGIFNFAVGLPLLLAPGQGVALMGVAPPSSMLFVQLSGALIVMFGVSYIMVSRDLALRPLAWLGAVGKLLAFGLLALYWQRGEVPDTPFVLGFGDLIFAVAFVWFLASRRAAK